MKRFMSALGVGMLCAGLVLTLMPRPVAAANSPVATADKALMAAFAKGDKATIEKYLDADFSWIDTDGVMVAKNDALAQAACFTTSLAPGKWLRASTTRSRRPV